MSSRAMIVFPIDKCSKTSFNQYLNDFFYFSFSYFIQMASPLVQRLGVSISNNDHQFICGCVLGDAATDRVNSSCSSGSAHCCWWFRWSRPSTRNRRHRSGSNQIRWPGSSSSISSWNSRENISNCSSRNSRLRPIIRLDLVTISQLLCISLSYILRCQPRAGLFLGGAGISVYCSTESM